LRSTILKSILGLVAAGSLVLSAQLKATEASAGYTDHEKAQAFIKTMVEKHNFESGQAYYELDSGEHHDHMVCVETGKVIEFVSEEIEELQKKIAADHGFEIEDHNLVIYVRPARQSR